MRWCFFAVLALVVVGCADDGQQSPPPAGEGYSADYGVDPTQYPMSCRLNAEVELEQISKTLEPVEGVDVQQFEFESFTPCRVSSDLCEEYGSPKTLYGEEPLGFVVRPLASTDYATTTFRLLRDGQVIREHTVEMRPTGEGPEVVGFWWELDAGHKPAQEGYAIEAEGPGGFDVEYSAHTRDHYIDPECTK